MKLTPLRTAAHPWDSTAAELHNVGTSRMPHQHLIRDDWDVELKNRAGDHIDRYHPPKDDANEMAR